MFSQCLVKPINILDHPNPADALANFTYGDLYLRLKIYPQNIVLFPPEHPKISAKTVNSLQMLQEFLNIVFIYEIFDSLNPELSDYEVNIP